MGGFVFELAFDRWRGADQPRFAPFRDTYRCFLHASRLGQDARDDRWACAAASPGDSPRACTRDRQGLGGIFARPSDCMSLSRRLVWHWTVADRAQLWPFDR